ADDRTCNRRDAHGLIHTLHSSCCASPTPASCLPTDPNFKESDPPANAYGYGYTEAGRRMTYRIHYQNVGGADAHAVAVLDPPDDAPHAAAPRIAAGAPSAPATRTTRWIDPAVPRATPRVVRFSLAVRAAAPPQTRIRNVATVLFPDAV